MSTMRYFLTSESVTEGHPDKLADQISDGVLDEILRQDPYARVAVESLLTTGQVVVAGEVTTKAYIDVQNIVRGVLKEAGYVKSEYGIDGDSCGVLVSLHEQSPDIALGVSGYRKERPEAVGAGDQGMMFGYASDETPELMPAPIAFAHRVTRRLAQARKSGEIKYLRPDGKSQVTVEYENGSVKRIHTVLVSAQHAPGVSIAKMKRDIVKKIIKKVLPKKLIDSKTKFLVNPTGRFVIGGPAGDTGLTGRKIIVDTYGGLAKHGGGAFFGKDPSKVDRSAAYAMRWAAKNLVASGLCKKAEVKVAYAIGINKPLAFNVDTFGTGKISDNRISDIMGKVFDFRPAAIIRDLDLLRPIYSKTAAYGHFGRTDIDLPWERTNKADEII